MFYLNLIENKKMKFYQSAIFVIATSICSATTQIVFAQNNSTLNTAKKMIAEGEKSDACKLLKSYSKYTDDGWALWLLGSVSSDLHRHRLSHKAYKQAIRLFPSNDMLLYDYAQKLVADGKVNNALRVLDEIGNDSVLAYKNIMLQAQIALWKDDVDCAEEILRDYSQQLAEDEELVKMRNAIARKKQCSVSLNSSLTTDGQPMTTLQNMASIAKLMNNYVNPGFSIGQMHVDADSIQFDAGNLGLQNSFYHAKSDIRGTAGLQLNNYNGSEFLLTGTMKISKNLWDRVKFEFSADRDRYLYTVGSLNEMVYTNAMRESVSYHNERLLVNFSNTDMRFNDANTQSSQALWALATVIKHSLFECKIGGAISASNASFDTYRSNQTVGDILSYYNSEDYEYGKSPEIGGSYRAYYSPQNETVKSIMASLILRPASKLTVNAFGSYGLEASADVPYLYLGYDGGDKLAIVKEYAETGFSPVHLKGNISWSLQEGCNLSVSYAYSSPNVFYQSKTLQVYLRFAL